MPSNSPRLLIPLAALLCSFSIASAASPVIGKIADTSTAAPAGSGSFSFFGSDPASGLIAPSYDGESILFSALDSQGKSGLYRWNAGSLAMVANTDTALPAGTSHFAHFYGSSISGLARIAFLADDNNKTGVFEINEGHLSLVADTTMNAKGTTSHFTSFSRPINSSFGPWYSGAYDTAAGPRSALYNYFAGSFSNPHVGQNTPVPGGNGNFTAVANPDYSTLIAFFGADDNGKQGIYRMNYNSPNPDTYGVIADTSMLIPGTTKNFATFDSSYISTSSQAVAFSAEDATGRSYLIKRILTGLNTGLRVVASDVGHPPLAVSGENIAFLRQGALYTDSPGSNPRVIGPGDILLGKTVSSISIGPDAFVGPNIVFAASFTDGSQGIFASNLPEPSVLSLLLACAVSLSRRARPLRLRGRST